MYTTFMFWGGEMVFIIQANRKLIRVERDEISICPYEMGELICKTDPECFTILSFLILVIFCAVGFTCRLTIIETEFHEGSKGKTWGIGGKRNKEGWRRFDRTERAAKRHWSTENLVTMWGNGKIFYWGCWWVAWEPSETNYGNLVQLEETWIRKSERWKGLINTGWAPRELDQNTERN